MSWPESFPILTDEMIDRFVVEATTKEHHEMDAWFSIAEVINKRADYDHLISTSLFWKRDEPDEDDLPTPTRDLFKNAADLGIANRLDPWSSYVEPILNCARRLSSNRSLVLRVYLAGDLRFLIEDLSGLNCEIFVMESWSILHNPGALWRFLAIEDEDCPVTVIDADRLAGAESAVARTEAAARASLGGWRIPYQFYSPPFEGYRPLNASQFGVIGRHPIRFLLKSFIWHNLHGLISIYADLGEYGRTQLASTEWPAYGFDEWFLLAALYPRLAFTGLLTFLPAEGTKIGKFLTLDIEYVTWANPASQVIFYTDPHSMESPPWHYYEESNHPVVRPNALLFHRFRKIHGCLQRIYSSDAPHLENIPFFNGTVIDVIDWGADSTKEKWLIDLSARIRPMEEGCELFLDDRFESVDIATCGYFFVRIDEQAAIWAAAHFPTLQWTNGILVKVPKIDGPITLWSIEFCKELRKHLIRHPDVRPELIVRALELLGEAAVVSVTAGAMGWKVR